MAARRHHSILGRSSVEAALRHLGAQRYGNLVEFIEHAIRWPEGQAGTVLAPLTEATEVLRDWTPSERAHAVWKMIEEGVVHPQVGPTPQSRRRRALQAAFRLPDAYISDDWGSSLTERFKQLRLVPGAFGNATSTQPMEMAWKRGVERLAEHLERELKELRTPEDWAPHRPQRADQGLGTITSFRPPSEGAQKLIVNLHVLTVLMRGKLEVRRTTERVVTSQDPDGLRYFRAWASSSEASLRGSTYAPTHALWGCRAEQVAENGRPVTRLWFPRPLMAGERAHFVTEVVHEAREDSSQGWANVGVDHFGIDRGELRDGLLPVNGLTIRIRFDRNCLPRAVWWYAELNDRERYDEPSPGSPRLLDVGSGDVAKTFEHLCQPREDYGITYSWA